MLEDLCMQIFRRIKFIRYILLFIVMNMALSFLLEPADGASGVMWKEYYLEDEIDTIFVGSSVSESTFNPYVFDEILGVKSFNMGTPSQAVPQTLQTIESALKDHDIKTVIFGMNYSTFKYSVYDEAELTFHKARVRNMESLRTYTESIKYMLSEELRGSEKSINFLFPWLYNRIELNAASILTNVKGKLHIGSNNSEKEKETSKKGFQNTAEGVFNYDNMWERNSFRMYDAEFDADMLETFEKLVKFCKEKGVELIVVATPHPPFDVVSCHEFYEENEKELLRICNAYDVDFYDFSLAKEELFAFHSDYYCDHEHLNLKGAQAFSECLAEFLRDRKNGENVEERFYSVQEFLDKYSELIKDWEGYSW